MIMYRVMDLSISKTYAWFYDLTEAEDYLKELGLGDKGIIDEVKIDNELAEENEQLKKELFEARKDYILETYADNPIRRDEKLKALEKELKPND